MNSLCLDEIIRVFLEFIALDTSGNVVAQPVPARTVGRLLARNGVKHAILNACRSGKELATHSSVAHIFVEEGLVAAGGMAYDVLDFAAGPFSDSFYRLFIGSGNDPTISFGLASLSMAEARDCVSSLAVKLPLHDCFVPVLYL